MLGSIPFPRGWSNTRKGVLEDDTLNLSVFKRLLGNVLNALMLYLLVSPEGKQLL